MPEAAKTPEPSQRHVNLQHPKQDVHAERAHRPGLFRFHAAGRLLPPPRAAATCLELGGGMGEFAEVLRAKGYEVTLADLSAANVRHARDLGFEAHRIDLNEPLPFEPEAFDGVAMLDVIEHVVNAEQLLAESARVLRPGGFLVLSTPNFAWIPERLRILRGRPPAEEGYHYRFFTVRSLRAAFGRAGLRVVRERYSMPAIGVNRLARTLFRRDRRRHFMVPAPLASFLGQTIFALARKPGNGPG
jgi:2-polyprenyl-3-methyl-5-hydroxy-6-metoxy-1,4-benzoquinol methylase